jgi:uncharacterized protein DUF2865
VKLWTRCPKRFALAAVAAASVMGSAPFVLANDGILEVILSGQRALQGSRAPTQPAFPAPVAPQYAPQPPRTVFRPQVSPSPAPRLMPAAQPPRIVQPPKPVVPPRTRQEWAKATVALPRSEEDGVKVSVSELGLRAVCVRMCDGYYFPAGDVGSSADVPAQEALCQARCPAAPVKLFTVEAGRDIEDARRGNQTYRNLPMAFAHQRSLDPTCSCERGPTQAKRVSILKDLTLKKGDVVVLDGGAKVFNGAERWPYKSRDFSDLKGSRTLGIVAQKQIERVVGLAPPDTGRRSLRGRGRSLDPAPASEALPEVEATRSVPAEGARKVRVIYSATDRYIAPESGTAALP